MFRPVLAEDGDGIDVAQTPHDVSGNAASSGTKALGDKSAVENDKNVVSSIPAVVASGDCVLWEGKFANQKDLLQFLAEGKGEPKRVLFYPGLEDAVLGR